MTQETTLIERLRRKRMRVHDLSGVGWEDDPDCIEAADALAALQARVEELERELRGAYEYAGESATAKLEWANNRLLDRSIAAEQDRDRLREALERAQVTINDWLVTYAPEHCNAASVDEAYARVGEYGTVGYIAHALEAISTALKETARGDKS